MEKKPGTVTGGGESKETSLYMMAFISHNTEASWQAQHLSGAQGWVQALLLTQGNLSAGQIQPSPLC